jgi:hypothetical protein
MSRRSSSVHAAFRVYPGAGGHGIFSCSGLPAKKNALGKQGRSAPFGPELRLTNHLGHFVQGAQSVVSAAIRHFIKHAVNASLAVCIHGFLALRPTENCC